MINVKIMNYNELPDDIKKQPLSNNGSGKEDAQYLVVFKNSKIIRVESDAMEPEDASFSRDLHWIKDAILEAYQIALDEI